MTRSEKRGYLLDSAAFLLILGIGAAIGQPFLGAAFGAGLLWSSLRTAAATASLRDKETAK